ncbi:MAG: hypothetical protein MRY64_11080 [Hyphomonadaceae bacterium]|nr:hypothetical protein [Hyphomonadaceae bacterium]
MSGVLGTNARILTDVDWRMLPDDKNYVLGKSQYDEDRVRHTSYELTLGYGRTLAGERLPQLQLESEETLEHQAYTVEEADGKVWLCLNPMQMCQLFTHEKVFMPEDMMGFVFARGQLFLKGLFVESTYIDPGYGPAPESNGDTLHLVAFNASGKVVRIPLGTAIARLQIFAFDQPVKEKHGGRLSVRPSEVESRNFPWPEKREKYFDEVGDARKLRDLDQRILVMDRHTHAFENFHEEFQKLKQSLFLHRVIGLVILGAGGLLLAQSLMLKHLPGDSDLRPWIESPITSFVVVAVPVIASFLTRTMRQSVKTVLGAD